MPSQPLPPGFTMRPPTVDDAEAVAGVMNAIDLAIVGAVETSPGRVRWQWERPNVDTGRDTRVVADPGGTVVGYVEYDAFQPWTQLEVDGYVHPEHTGNGVGSALMDWALERAGDDVVRAPAGAQVVIRHFLWDADVDGRAFLEARDWRVCRWFYWMLIELDAPVPPPGAVDGIELRPMRPGEEREVWATDDDAFKDHWGYVSEPFDDWRHRHMGREGFDPGLVFVAMDGEQMVGCSVGFPTRDEDPDKGWVQSLGVRRAWRRRGIAVALLQATLGAMRDRGCLRAGLGVDADNPTGAVALYEKAGMDIERRAVSYELELRPASTPT